MVICFVFDHHHFGGAMDNSIVALVAIVIVQFVFLFTYPLGGICLAFVFHCVYLFDLRSDSE